MFSCSLFTGRFSEELRSTPAVPDLTAIWYLQLSPPPPSLPPSLSLFLPPPPPSFPTRSSLPSNPWPPLYIPFICLPLNPEVKKRSISAVKICKSRSCPLIHGRSKYEFEFIQCSQQNHMKSIRWWYLDSITINWLKSTKRKWNWNSIWIIWNESIASFAIAPFISIYFSLYCH